MGEHFLQESQQAYNDYIAISCPGHF